MSFKNSLRDRAIAAFRKAYGLKSDEFYSLRADKRRSNKTIRVSDGQGSIGIWSYKNGGKLEKVA